MKENSTTVFKAKKFAICFVIIHVVPYLIMAFVELSFTKILIEVFSSNQGRGLYIAYLISTLLATAPIYLPFIDKNEKP